MNRNDFNLIHEFIDKGNPKIELSYALVSHDGIYATNTRRAIKYHIPMLDCTNMLASKKIIKCVAQSIEKGTEVSINAEGSVMLDSRTSISLCNRTDEIQFPDMEKILTQNLEYYMELSDITDVHFELTQKECFVDDIHLRAIIEYSDCDNYKIFFNKQKNDGDMVNTGAVKIVGEYNTEDEVGLIKFTALIMGREFKTQAKEQLLMNL